MGLDDSLAKGVPPRNARRLIRTESHPSSLFVHFKEQALVVIEVSLVEDDLDTFCADQSLDQGGDDKTAFSWSSMIESSRSIG